MSQPHRGDLKWAGTLIGCLCLGIASIAAAQSSAGPDPSGARKPTAQEQRARAIARCLANRGVDCESAEGLKEWIQQERPITDEERRNAAAARRIRTGK